MKMLTARNKVLSGIVVALVLLGLIVPAAMAATAPPLNLPPQAVTIAYGLYLQEPAPWDAAFKMTLTGVGSGFDVADGVPYRGWCLENGVLSNSNPVILYSSYDPNLPPALKNYTNSIPPIVQANPGLLNQPIPWDKLNYLLNHKQGTRDDVQAAIKLLIWGASTDPVPSATATAMVTAANASGSGFVPAPGQIVAVLSGEGIGTSTTFQDTVLELTMPNYDLGDLPATYPTLLATGPSHQLGGNMFLGACVDAESDGQPNTPATGDNALPLTGYGTFGTCATAGQDEDGVTRVAGRGGANNGGGWTNGSVDSGNGGAVQVTITGGAACLGAFFDFAHSGTTLTLPQLYQLVGQNYVAVNSPFDPGTYTFYFDIAADTFNGTPPGQPIYARFRVTSPVNGQCTGAAAAAFSPTTPATTGEVEDYVWNFGPNAVTLSGMTASSAASPLTLPLGLVTILGVLLGGIVLARRPV